MHVDTIDTPVDLGGMELDESHQGSLEAAGFDVPIEVVHSRVDSGRGARVVKTRGERFARVDCILCITLHRWRSPAAASISTGARPPQRQRTPSSPTVI